MMISKLDSSVQVIPTGCPHDCSGHCLLKAHIKDGRLLAITTDDGEEPQLRACLKGRAYRQRLYAPDRLLYPLKRTGERGKGEFKRISWDEALDKVAGELTRIKQNYGNAAIFGAGGAGNNSLVHFPRVWMAYFLAKLGGFTGTRGGMSYQGATDASLYTLGSIDAGNQVEDVLNSRLIILWSWNSAEMVYGTNTTWVLAQAHEKGIPVVLIDPRCNDTTVLADEWIPIYPGTDTAMMVAMAYVILTEGIHNREFLDKYTTGLDRFLAYLNGREDGTAKTPAWAEKITGVPAAKIEGLARRYATTRPAALIPGLGMQRTACGEQSFRASITLAAMTGNIGVAGGNPAGFWHTGRQPNILPAVPNPIRNTFPNSRWSEAVIKGKEGGFGADIKMIYACASGLIGQKPNLNKSIEALKKVAFVVCQDQFLTGTARFADIVLPVTMSPEQNDIKGYWGMGHSIVFGNKVVEPAGECRSDMDIFSELARRLNITGYSTKTEEELLRETAAAFGVPDFEEFRRKGVYHLPRPKPSIAFEEEIADPAHHPFKTPSGKIEIYSQRLADMKQPDTIPAIPKYIEAWEGRQDPLRLTYPFQLLTPHGKKNAHSPFGNIPWVQEVDPHAVWINPLDAKPRGIRNGDLVKVFNDRGTTMIEAKVTERIMPGVVSIDHGMWYKPDERGVDRGGSVNVLTKDEDTPIGDGATTHTCLVQIERA
jgi:anaerobic dimethyl sulfoxide reductase subunit A